MFVAILDKVETIIKETVPESPLQTTILNKIKELDNENKDRILSTIKSQITMFEEEYKDDIN